MGGDFNFFPSNDQVVEAGGEVEEESVRTASVEVRRFELAVVLLDIVIIVINDFRGIIAAFIRSIRVKKVGRFGRFSRLSP